MRTAEILDRLVGFDTTSAKSNLEAVDYIDDFLRARGFETYRIPDPGGTKAGLFASLGPAGPGGILLSGHTDVVPVTGQIWSTDPFRLTREGDRLYGRGTTDMKGFIAAVMAMAERASGTSLSEPLKIAFSYDEEIGCVGIGRMIGFLDKTIGRPRACIVGEPTGMRVAIGHKGKAAFRAVCTGRAGHSALAPRFVNALHLAGDFMSGLRGIQDALARDGARDDAYAVPHTTLHVGTLRGGEALNIVPDRAEMAFEVRYLAADAPDDLTARIAAAAERASAPFRALWPGAGIEIAQVNSYPGLDLPADDEIVSEAQAFAATDGTVKVAFGTEAGYFQGLDIPTVVCGPGSMEAQGHQPDEYLELSELRACDAMLGRVLERLTA